MGRSVELEAEGREFLLQVEDLRSAWALGRNISAATAPILRTLGGHGFELRLNIGRRWKVKLLPKPNLVIRLLFPGLRFPPHEIPG